MSGFLQSSVTVVDADGRERTVRASTIRLEDGFLTFLDEWDRPLFSLRADRLGDIRLPNVYDTINAVVRKTTAELVDGNGKTYRHTQRYIRRTFTSFYAMNVMLFCLGMFAFGMAVVKGASADSASQATPAILFGGLSVTSFITVFLTRPMDAVAVAGPRLSWLLAMLNTYWTRLAYFTDSRTIDEDLVRAEANLVAGLAQYFEKVGATARRRRSMPRTGTVTPDPN
jgi:hypothetical protein